MAAQTIKGSRVLIMRVRIMLGRIMLACIMPDFVLCLNSYYACLHYA